MAVVTVVGKVAAGMVVAMMAGKVAERKERTGWQGGGENGEDDRVGQSCDLEDDDKGGRQGDDEVGEVCGDEVGGWEDVA